MNNFSDWFVIDGQAYLITMTKDGKKYVNDKRSKDSEKYRTYSETITNG